MFSLSCIPSTILSSSDVFSRFSFLVDDLHITGLTPAAKKVCLIANPELLEAEIQAIADEFDKCHKDAFDEDCKVDILNILDGYAPDKRAHEKLLSDIVFPIVPAATKLQQVTVLLLLLLSLLLFMMMMSSSLLLLLLSLLFSLFSLLLL